MTTKDKALTIANTLLATDRVTLGQLSHKELMMTLVHVVEQHKAFRQEVSDALLRYHAPSHVPHGLQEFIIPKPKPDPLVDLLADIDVGAYDSVKAEYADLLRKDLVGRLRAALEARGLEIREKGQCPCTNSCSITSGGIFTTGPTMRFGSDK